MTLDRGEGRSKRYLLTELCSQLWLAQNASAW